MTEMNEFYMVGFSGVQMTSPCYSVSSPSDLAVLRSVGQKCCIVCAAVLLIRLLLVWITPDALTFLMQFIFLYSVVFLISSLLAPQPTF